MGRCASHKYTYIRCTPCMYVMLFGRLCFYLSAAKIATNSEFIVIPHDHSSHINFSRLIVAWLKCFFCVRQCQGCPPSNAIRIYWHNDSQDCRLDRLTIRIHLSVSKNHIIIDMHAYGLGNALLHMDATMYPAILINKMLLSTDGSQQRY